MTLIHRQENVTTKWQRFSFIVDASTIYASTADNVKVEQREKRKEERRNVFGKEAFHRSSLALKRLGMTKSHFLIRKLAQTPNLT
jgi:hypothetical protein